MEQTVAEEIRRVRNELTWIYVAVFLSAIGIAIGCGTVGLHLRRIADALEKQNAAYVEREGEKR